jgi:hypothetical protein
VIEVRKVILTGLTAGVLMLFVNLILSPVFSFVFPNINKEYSNTAIFRPFTDPLMFYVFIHPFMVGVILAWVWSRTNSLIKEKKVFWKCCRFALAYWLITIPGMLISYSTFQVSLSMIISWTLAMLAQSVVAAWLFSKKLN